MNNYYILMFKSDLSVRFSCIFMYYLFICFDEKFVNSVETENCRRFTFYVLRFTFYVLRFTFVSLVGHFR